MQLDVLFDQARFQIGFWLTWLLIPLLVDLFPTIFYFGKLFFKKITTSGKSKKLTTFPRLSILVPVYNSQDTLEACLTSIVNSNYPTALLQVLVIDNQSSDASFEVYQQVKQTFPSLNMHWLSSPQGKANALNLAIYNSTGSYIINIDSDGILHPSALSSMMTMFLNYPEYGALTGTILTQKDEIRRTKFGFLRLLRECEYFEYAQSFLAGRAVEGQANQLLTLAGAFCAFRRETLLQTQMYNTQTVGEDIDMTFQVREKIKHKVGICSEALFFVDPVDNLEKLYTQRQRWQRGEIEAIANFMHQRSDLHHFFNNFVIRRLLIDHTFAFPKLVWLIGMGIMVYLGYSAKLLAISLALIYLLYVLNSTVILVNISLILRRFKDERRFYLQHWWLIFIWPFYNLLCAAFRLIGILNAITKPAKWQAQSFKAEKQTIATIIKADLKQLRQKIRGN